MSLSVYLPVVVGAGVLLGWFITRPQTPPPETFLMPTPNELDFGKSKYPPASGVLRVPDPKQTIESRPKWFPQVDNTLPRVENFFKDHEQPSTKEVSALYKSLKKPFGPAPYINTLNVEH